MPCFVTEVFRSISQREVGGVKDAPCRIYLYRCVGCLPELRGMRGLLFGHVCGESGGMRLILPFNDRTKGSDCGESDFPLLANKRFRIESAH